MLRLCTQRRSMSNTQTLDSAKLVNDCYDSFQDLSSIKDKNKTPNGLKNKGYTCWLNVILQMLYNCKGFREMTLEGHCLQMSECLQQLYTVFLQLEMARSFLPDNFIKYLDREISNTFPDFTCNKPNSVYDMLKTILQMMPKHISESYFGFCKKCCHDDMCLLTDDKCENCGKDLTVEDTPVYLITRQKHPKGTNMNKYESEPFLVVLHQGSPTPNHCYCILRCGHKCYIINDDTVFNIDSMNGVNGTPYIWVYQRLHSGDTTNVTTKMKYVLYHIRRSGVIAVPPTAEYGNTPESPIVLPATEKRILICS